MLRLIKKSIFVIQNYGLKVFLIKARQCQLNKINLFKQRLSEKKAKKNPEKVIKKLKEFKSGDPEEIFDFSWNFYSGLIRPIQIKEEFLELLKIFQELNPKYIMEIGTAKGGTLFCFCKLARKNATIISIDLPEGPFGGGYPEWKILIYQAFTKENQKLFLLRKDSHSQETLEEVKKILDNKHLDFLFIDGDHTYEGVKKDFEMYSSLVRKGGIIAFHDIVENFWRDPIVGCNKFFRDLNYNKKKIISDSRQGWAGIGLVFFN